MTVSFGWQRAAPPYTLYARAGDGAGGPRAYLLLSGPPPESPLYPMSAWAYPVAYIAAAAEVTMPLAALAAAVGLANPSGNTRVFAWVDATGTALAAVPVATTSRASGQVTAPVAVPFGNLAFLVPSGAAVAVAADGLTLGASLSDDPLQLQRVSSGAVMSPDGLVTFGLAAGATGALGFTGTWSSWDFFALVRDDTSATDAPGGGEIRYFAASAGGGYHQLVYPLLPTAAKDSTLVLDVRLDPLAPYDGTRTAFRMPEPPAGFAAANARTVTGAPVMLTPQPGAAFWLARRPDTLGTREPNCVYLAPAGPFALPAGPTSLMCGLSGLEALSVAGGDVLDLTPNGAALAGTTPGAAPLDPAFTTAWASFVPAAARRYVGQPSASVSYAPGARAGMTLPAAVGSLLADLPAAPTAAFPWAPYGAAAVTTPDTPRGLPTTVEANALAGVRSDVLRRKGSGPMLALADTAPASPVFLGADGKPLPGGRGATPNGQVVVLNPDGTWHQVLLASTPAGEASFNGLGDTGVVDPTLASALLREQLFLVVSDWDKFAAGTVTSRLRVDGWDLDIAPATGAPPPILVFKYATSASLRELAATTDAWADAGWFVGDAGAIDATAKQLAHAFKAANPGTLDDPFVAFRRIADDPSWTGLICFGARVDGKSMPPDLTMLLAGIGGALTAHHIGINANRVEVNGGTLDLAESSVFGVIHVPPAPPPVTKPYGYRVLQLDVVFTNSAVSDFHAQVGVRLSELFGRAVTLAKAQPAPAVRNEAVLRGTYQEHGGVGTVTFALEQPASYAFAAPPTVRVLDTFLLTDASLAPAAPAAGSGDSGARVTLGGTLSFAAAPFATAPELDLFSYGGTGGGLRLSGLALDLSFSTADPLPWPLTILANYAGVTVSDAGATAREGSIVSRLPLTATAFLANPNGIDAVKLGGKTVHVVELEGTEGKDGARPSYTTSAVTYAVAYRLPLGSLGALSDMRASLDATLVVGWGPSTYTPGDDGAALYVSLPGVSAGAFSFNLQGLLTTNFGDATLSRVVVPDKGPTWVLLFNNVALSVLGYTFPPQVVADLVLFAGADLTTPQPLGWSLSAVQTVSGS